jgi:hypothetical protein
VCGVCGRSRVALRVMANEFHKPVRMSSARLEASLTGDPADMVMDPAEVSAIAHDTARALVNRGRDSASAELVTRLVRFSDEHGLDTVAELWAQASAASLPGALWRLYLVRAVLRHNLDDARELFQRGMDDLGTIDKVVAGAPDPLSAEALAHLLDNILRGVFDGELAEALNRASSVARAVSAGAISLAWGAHEDAEYLTKRSLNWSLIADELHHAAALARRGALD